MFPASAANFPNIGMSSDLTNSAYLQFNSPQQMVSYGGLDTGINPPYMGLKRTMSAHVSMPETYLHSSSFTVGFPTLYLYLVILLNFLNLVSFTYAAANAAFHNMGR